MNWLTNFLFWGWARLFLGRKDWELLERSIKIAKQENSISAELGYDPRTKHLISYARVRKELGDPTQLTGAIVHIAVALAYLEYKRASERLF